MHQIGHVKSYIVLSWWRLRSPLRFQFRFRIEWEESHDKKNATGYARIYSNIQFDLNEINQKIAHRVLVVGGMLFLLGEICDCCDKSRKKIVVVCVRCWPIKNPKRNPKFSNRGDDCHQPRSLVWKERWSKSGVSCFCENVKNNWSTIE